MNLHPPISCLSFAATGAFILIFLTHFSLGANSLFLGMDVLFAYLSPSPDPAIVGIYWCLSLILWLEERYKTVYTRHPAFQKGSKPLLALDNPFPMELPENLNGEKWAFVQLPFAAVREEVSSLETRYAFGASLDLDLLGIEVDDKALIPGLAVASSRAKSLAAWMNGLEICSVEADVARACLILSVGISSRYVYARYKKTSLTTSEAEAWEAAKKDAGGLHFLAIQDDLESDDCAGFWLLLDLPPPPV